ncbi:MAG: hypothetical protein WAO08_19130 [Hyphomicrobiaceae bacterium]|jgi:hypothetical protein|nr:MAG: hypothetical protein EHM67_08515 [Hyphomicrobiaceae bacterium]
MRATLQANRRRKTNPGLPRFVYPNGKGYRALIRSGDKVLYLGTFDTPRAASAAAEKMASRLRGKSYTPAKRPIAPKRKAAGRSRAAKRRRKRSD